MIVGGGTVRADDPLLTSRGRRAPEPLRVVLSRSMELPLQAQLWNTDVAPTLVAHGRRHAMVQRPVDLSCCPCLCVIRIT